MPEDSAPDVVDEEPDDEWNGQFVDRAELELVYEKSWTVTSNGESSPAKEFGELDLPTWQRVARPGSFSHESWTFLEDSGRRVAADGTAQHWYRVRRMPNIPTTPSPQPPAAPDLSSRLQEAVSASEPGEKLQITLKLRSYPAWNIPLVPREGAMPAAAIATARHDRELALDARATDFDSRIQAVAALIEDDGGELVRRFWTAGWLVARCDAATIAKLSLRTELQTIDLDAIDIAPLSQNLKQIRSRTSTDAEVLG